jgi:putative ABC transport system ATP-binding protein
LILKANNISHSFDYQLFKNISLEMNSKDIFSIVGSSGCGKSTLLNILSSFQKPDTGEIELFGKNIYNIDDDELLKILREKLGIIFQSHYLFKGFTAKENLEISNMLAHTQLNMELLEKLKIDNILNQQIGELSGGQQQRLSMARVRMRKPTIIFADEPTGNLDNTTANEVMNVIFDYINNNGALMILVTHDLTLANKCNRVLKLTDLSLKDISN